MFDTLGSYLELDIDEWLADDVLELSFVNGSTEVSDLMIYRNGSCAQNTISSRARSMKENRRGR